ncbi:MAG: hypothetical protein ACXVP5_00365 [Tumebacillaceae bacterium]
MAKLRLKESLGTNLLISLLIRYPELSSLRYNPMNTMLSFTILVKGDVEPARQTEFVTRVADYFAACQELDPNFSPLGRIEQAADEGVTVIMYEQKLETLTIAETRLFMELVTEFYRGQIGDTGTPLHEDDAFTQEEIIETILGQKEHLREEKSIVAYREGGRVFVYNK